MAAPVFAADGTMALALVTLGYSATFEPDRGRIAQAVLQCAGRLSKRLGKHPQP
jgi:DNA-binding IclR family transcriptional regulator